MCSPGVTFRAWPCEVCLEKARDEAYKLGQKEANA